MPKIKIIAEIGSCHNGKLDYCKEAIDRLCEMGADAIKFQLFPNDPKFTSTGNVWLAPEMYADAAQYAEESGLDCSASVFSQECFDLLLETHPRFIKFSFSKKDEIGWIYESLESGIETIVSCDVMTDAYVPKATTRLFCVPQYPVYQELSFDEIFPRFHGFSDHTLGYRQTLNAIDAGALIIEKHMKLLKPDIQCPDSFFALSTQEFSRMVKDIRVREREL